MLNRIKTTGLAASALLAMTTSALAVGFPPGTVEITGTFETATNAAAGGMNPAYQYNSYVLEITDPSALLAVLETSGSFSNVLWLAPGEFDHTDPMQISDASYLTESLGTVTYGAQVPALGTYTLLVGYSGGGVPGVDDLSYTLYLNGVAIATGSIEDLAGEQSAVAANHIAQALSASIFSAVKSGLAGGTPVVSREAPGLNTTEGNRTWFQMDYTAIDGTDLDGRFPTMQAGLDFQLENGMIVGAALGYSDFSISSAASDLDGTSLSIQPYLGFRSGEVTGAVTLSFGKLDLETTDGAGTAEGDMRALSLSLERPFALGGNQVIASFDGGFGRQEIDTATGSLSGMADTYSTWSYASLGARYEMQAGAALMSFGASVDYNDVGNLDNIAADHYGSDGFTGAVNFGLDYQMGSGSNLYVNAEIGGIGGDALRKSVQAGIDFRF